jgi:hypothetical protein
VTGTKQLIRYTIVTVFADIHESTIHCTSTAIARPLIDKSSQAVEIVIGIGAGLAAPGEITFEANSLGGAVDQAIDGNHRDEGREDQGEAERDKASHDESLR